MAYQVIYYIIYIVDTSLILCCSSSVDILKKKSGHEGMLDYTHVSPPLESFFLSQSSKSVRFPMVMFHSRFLSACHDDCNERNRIRQHSTIQANWHFKDVVQSSRVLFESMIESWPKDYHGDMEAMRGYLPNTNLPTLGFLHGCVS